jgi:hypothetical protein
VGAIFRSSTQLANLSKTIVFTTYLHVFTLWKNITFDSFRDLYHYLFWMRFGHRFGVLFGTSWATKSTLLGNRF